MFSNVALVLRDRERVGLVGSNGAGKSTLLRMLASVDPLQAGRIVRAKDTRFGYLAQSAADETQATLTELVDAALARVPDADWALQRKRLLAMLDAFGFDDAAFSRPLREFSGGQRAKAALAHLLIDDPDYLLLDEPTNHLDIATVRWLEDHIVADKRAYVVVSHDRYFLDRIATQVWELDRGTLHVYRPARPAYSEYVRQRDARKALVRETYERFVSDREKQRSTIAGLRATLTSSNYSRVRSREKQLARAEESEAPPPPEKDAAPIGVRLRSARRATTSFSFEVEGVAKAYAQTLFEDVTFNVEQGSRLAIVGPNGSGKSTLLKILADELLPDAGTVRFNPAARAAYFTQNAQDQLDPDVSAVDAVLATGTVSDQEARGLLGRMRLSGEAADKPVRSFSGGERRRIMLACLMARKCDVLLLDEPTNDLDIASREALEDVLDSYDGTIVVVSHDRYLLDRLCDRVLWIEDGRWGLLEGGYAGYEALERTRKPTSQTEAPKPSTRMTPLKQRSQLAAKIARVEREITRLDARKAEIDTIFTTVEVYEDRARVKALESEREDVSSQSEKLLATWESLHAEIDALD